MTGTFVKLGQHLAGALTGGPRWQWLPYPALWACLVAGAAAGDLDIARSLGRPAHLLTIANTFTSDKGHYHT